MFDISPFFWQFVRMVEELPYEKLCETIEFDRMRNACNYHSELFIARDVVGVDRSVAESCMQTSSNIVFDNTRDGFKMYNVDIVFSAIPPLLEKQGRNNEALLVRRCLNKMYEHIDVTDLTNMLDNM